MRPLLLLPAHFCWWGHPVPSSAPWHCPGCVQDPTGAIGGTITKQALAAEPGIQPGSVLLLDKVLVAFCGERVCRCGWCGWLV